MALGSPQWREDGREKKKILKRKKMSRSGREIPTVTDVCAKVTE